MTPRSKILVVVVLIALVVGAALWYHLDPNRVPISTPDESSGRVMDIQTYVKSNISQLSPVKEQVGGTFYVTDIETDGEKGVVEYEDGHNAYVADFTYILDPERGITIGTFVVRSLNQ